MNNQRAGKRMKRRGSKSKPISTTVIGDGRILPSDRFTDKLLNDPNSDDKNSDHDEKDD